LSGRKWDVTVDADELNAEIKLIVSNKPELSKEVENCIDIASNYNITEYNSLESTLPTVINPCKHSTMDTLLYSNYRFTFINGHPTNCDEYFYSQIINKYLTERIENCTTNGINPTFEFLKGDYTLQNQICTDFLSFRDQCIINDSSVNTGTITTSIESGIKFCDFVEFTFLLEKSLYTLLLNGSILF
jgi:hypothetical protein